MKLCSSLIGFVLMGAVGSLIQVQSASPAPPACGLLIPAYFYPRGAGLAHWDTLILEAAREPRLEIVAIVNPASGPGRRVDAAYTQVLERCRKTGVKAGGYVSTEDRREWESSHGLRPLHGPMQGLTAEGYVLLSRYALQWSRRLDRHKRGCSRSPLV